MPMNFPWCAACFKNNEGFHWCNKRIIEDHEWHVCYCGLVFDEEDGWEHEETTM